MSILEKPNRDRKGAAYRRGKIASDRFLTGAVRNHLLLIIPLLFCGCHGRKFYRNQADSQADELVREKETDPLWTLPEFSVYPDERSRYYDIHDPDHPPMPPDDPASHLFMHCIDGMKGYERWHKDGNLVDLENPFWTESLCEFMERDEEGNYVMQLGDATRLALIHSPAFRRKLETLYLSALDVAFERFRFDVQFFGGNTTTYTHRGSENTRNIGRSSSLLEAETFLEQGNSRTRGARAGLQKLLPTGGEFLADFANTFVWQFAGQDRNVTAQSLLGFVFVQPLLRAGGRDVVMERLTIAERVLLANVRQMVRYREGFLLDIAFGTGAGQGPKRRGGFLGGSGLTGFTGQGQGGFGGVGEASGFGRIGGGGGGGGAAGGAAGSGFAAGVAGSVDGFYGLVQEQQQIENRKANLTAQLENLARVEALFEAGRIDRLQVEQFRQNVQSARSQHLDATTRYQRSMERLLTDTLGLPPDLPVRIDDSIAGQFRFVDPRTTAFQNELKTFHSRIRTEKNPTGQQLESAIDELERFQKQSVTLLEAVSEDFRDMESVRDQRLTQLGKPADRADREEYLDQVRMLTDRFEQFDLRLEEIAEGTKALRALAQEDQLELVHEQLTEQTEKLSDLLLEISLIQVGVRLESVVLETVRIQSDEALRIALTNRLDIMNRRAEVVDQWRLIQFNANQLESDVDLVFSGDLGTLGRNPAKFRDQTGTLSVGIRFDAPLTRLGERNEYRQSLIDYQRARRDFIQFQDGVHRGLRSLIGRLRQYEKEMQFRRRAMRIAIRTVEQTQEQLRQPPRVRGAGTTTSSLGPTAVRDLLAALSDLLQTQNDVMATSLNYELLRVHLYRNLGVIEFDENGIWLDVPFEEILERIPDSEPCLPPVSPTLEQKTRAEKIRLGSACKELEVVSEDDTDEGPTIFLLPPSCEPSGEQVIGIPAEIDVEYTSGTAEEIRVSKTELHSQTSEGWRSRTPDQPIASEDSTNH